MKGQITLESMVVIAVYFSMIAAVLSFVIYAKDTVDNNSYTIAAKRIAENIAFRLDIQSNDLPSHRAQQSFKTPTEYAGQNISYAWINGSLRVTIGNSSGGAYKIKVTSIQGGLLQTRGIEEEPI